MSFEPRVNVAATIARLSLAAEHGRRDCRQCGSPRTFSERSERNSHAPASIDGRPAHPRHRRRHRPRQGHGRAVPAPRRRHRDLRPAQVGLRRDRGRLAPAISRAPHRQLRRRHPGRPGGRGDGRRAVAVGRPDRAGQQRRRQFHRPDRKPLAARLRCHRQHRLPRQLLRHPGGRQALDRRREERPMAARAAVSQRRQHRHDLGRQRLALRRAVGDEQGRDRHHDQVARGRVGPLRDPPERGRAGRDSDRRDEQAPQPRRGAGCAQQGAQPDGHGPA